MEINALLATFAENLLPILLLGGVGFMLGKLIAVDSRSLGRLVFYTFSPILVFNLILHTNLGSGEILITMGYALVACTLTGVLALAFGWFMHFERPVLMALIMTSAFGNTGNYGLPLVSFAFGKQALAFASLFFVTNSILFNTAGVLMASLGHMDLRTAFNGIFKVPGVYAVLLAFLLNRFHVVLPFPLIRTVELAAAGSIPLMLVLLGLELSRVSWSYSMKPIGLSVALRLIAGPVIGLLLAVPFGLQGSARYGNVTETAMPAAVTNMVLAAEYGLDTSLVTAMVFLSTVLSPLTLTPLLVYLGR
jgi:predicted permease